MTKKQFDALGEYSCSVPTGVTIGKQWKCNRLAFAACGYEGEDWYLCEYIECKKPGYVGIKYKKIHMLALKMK